MRATPIEELKEISILAKGIEILTGVETPRLYVPVWDFPVVDSETDRVVGHFTFDSESEKIVYRATAL